MANAPHPFLSFVDWRRSLSFTDTEIDLRDAKITAEVDLDFRGTRGVAKDAPVGFSNIRIHVDVDTNADQDQLDTH